jgi:hypothetical protein
MRMYEFIKENASAGGTFASSVASIAQPLQKNDENQTFFGGESDDFPKYGDTAMAVIRRPKVPTTKDKK